MSTFHARLEVWAPAVQANEDACMRAAQKDGKTVLRNSRFGRKRVSSPTDQWARKPVFLP
jgi:hypothetical protein